jgi:hypothetical protein
MRKSLSPQYVVYPRRLSRRHLVYFSRALLSLPSTRALGVAGDALSIAGKTFRMMAVLAGTSGTETRKAARGGLYSGIC